MKLIIAGSRTIDPSFDFILDVGYILKLPAVLEIVSGGASGVDKAAERFAERMDIDLKVFSADWNKHGKAAGPIRNREMANYADALLLIWDGESRGSLNMKMEMNNLGKPIYEVILKKNNV